MLTSCESTPNYFSRRSSEAKFSFLDEILAQKPPPPPSKVDLRSISGVRFVIPVRELLGGYFPSVGSGEYFTGQQGCKRVAKSILANEKQTDKMRNYTELRFKKM